MTSINILLGTAAFLGFIHTIAGPDHYLPFIVMSKARKWSLKKTLFTTVYCGLGHLVSTIIIGFIGIALGWGIFYVERSDSVRESIEVVETLRDNIDAEKSKLRKVETIRGSLAGLVFVAFGLAYMIWGIIKLKKNKSKNQTHSHGGIVHSHHSTTLEEHEHSSSINDVEGKRAKLLTPWVLFIIFVLGPCEILIPLLMVPAASHNINGIIAISLMFSITTILTMCATVTLGYYGFKLLPTSKIERYMHIIAGATIFVSGIAFLFFYM